MLDIFKQGPIPFLYKLYSTEHSIKVYANILFKLLCEDIMNMKTLQDNANSYVEKGFFKEIFTYNYDLR